MRTCVAAAALHTAIRAWDRGVTPGLLFSWLAVQANGEEPPESSEPQIDVEAEVEAAMAAVKQSAVSEVTDADVLSALLEQEVVSKSSIVHALALHRLEAAC